MSQRRGRLNLSLQSVPFEILWDDGVGAPSLYSPDSPPFSPPQQPPYSPEGPPFYSFRTDRPSHDGDSCGYGGSPSPYGGCCGAQGGQEQGQRTQQQLSPAKQHSPSPVSPVIFQAGGDYSSPSPQPPGWVPNPRCPLLQTPSPVRQGATPQYQYSPMRVSQDLTPSFRRVPSWDGNYPYESPQYPGRGEPLQPVPFSLDSPSPNSAFQSTPDTLRSEGYGPIYYNPSRTQTTTRSSFQNGGNTQNLSAQSGNTEAPQVARRLSFEIPGSRRCSDASYRTPRPTFTGDYPPTPPPSLATTAEPSQLSHAPVTPVAATPVGTLSPLHIASEVSEQPSGPFLAGPEARNVTFEQQQQMSSATTQRISATAPPENFQRQYRGPLAGTPRFSPQQQALQSEQQRAPAEWSQQGFSSLTSISPGSGPQGSVQSPVGSPGRFMPSPSQYGDPRIACHQQPVPPQQPQAQDNASLRQASAALQSRAGSYERLPPAPPPSRYNISSTTPFSNNVFPAEEPPTAMNATYTVSPRALDANEQAAAMNATYTLSPRAPDAYEQAAAMNQTYTIPSRPQEPTGSSRGTTGTEWSSHEQMPSYTGAPPPASQQRICRGRRQVCPPLRSFSSDGGYEPDYSSQANTFGTSRSGGGTTGTQWSYYSQAPSYTIPPTPPPTHASQEYSQNGRSGTQAGSRLQNGSSGYEAGVSSGMDSAYSQVPSLRIPRAPAPTPTSAQQTLGLSGRPVQPTICPIPRASAMNSTTSYTPQATLTTAGGLTTTMNSTYQSSSAYPGSTTQYSTTPFSTTAESTNVTIPSVTVPRTPFPTPASRQGPDLASSNVGANRSPALMSTLSTSGGYQPDSSGNAGTLTTSGQQGNTQSEGSPGTCSTSCTSQSTSQGATSSSANNSCTTGSSSTEGGTSSNCTSGSTGSGSGGQSTSSGTYTTLYRTQLIPGMSTTSGSGGSTNTSPTSGGTQQQTSNTSSSPGPETSCNSSDPTSSSGASSRQPFGALSSSQRSWSIPRTPPTTPAAGAGQGRNATFVIPSRSPQSEVGRRMLPVVPPGSQVSPANVSGGYYADDSSSTPGSGRAVARNQTPAAAGCPCPITSAERARYERHYQLCQMGRYLQGVTQEFVRAGMPPEVLQRVPLPEWARNNGAGGVADVCNACPSPSQDEPYMRHLKSCMYAGHQRQIVDYLQQITNELAKLEVRRCDENAFQAVMQSRYSAISPSSTESSPATT